MKNEFLAVYRVLIQQALAPGAGFSPIRLVLLFEAASVDRARFDADEYLESLEGRFEVVEVRSLEPSRVSVPPMTAMA